MRQMAIDKGYQVLDTFNLPDHAWWDDFYTPMLERIAVLRKKNVDVPETESVYAACELEADMHRRYSSSYGYTFPFKNQNSSKNAMCGHSICSGKNWDCARKKREMRCSALCFGRSDNPDFDVRYPVQRVRKPISGALKVNVGIPQAQFRRSVILRAPLECQCSDDNKAIHCLCGEYLSRKMYYAPA